MPGRFLSPLKHAFSSSLSPHLNQSSTFCAKAPCVRVKVCLHCWKTMVMLFGGGWTQFVCCPCCSQPLRASGSRIQAQGDATHRDKDAPSWKWQHVGLEIGLLKSPAPTCCVTLQTLPIVITHGPLLLPFRSAMSGSRQQGKKRSL